MKLLIIDHNHPLNEFQASLCGYPPYVTKSHESGCCPYQNLGGAHTPNNKISQEQRSIQFNTLGLKPVYVIFNNSVPTENTLRLNYKHQLFSAI
jgi:hypothetical protein